MLYRILSKDKKHDKFHIYIGRVGSSYFKHNFVMRCDSYTDKNVSYLSCELAVFNYGITLFWVI
jgi:hypothetical protein